MTFVFWIAFGIVVYTFLGYAVLLFVLVNIKRKIIGSRPVPCPTVTPTCSVLIAAYNEEAFIREKIANTLSLNYPPDRLQIIIVADGSSDKTVDIVKEYPNVRLLYEEARLGKVHAINRAMEYIDSEVVVFTDANTYLNNDALQLICNHYQDPTIGGVAGEKRIFTNTYANASAAGESMYWKYESTLKKWDSELNTAIGAAGELFSIRTHLHQPVPENTILDDFIISMQIVLRGFRIVYEPKAYALETSSSSVQEELKRKVRIAAGGMQSIIAMRRLLLPFKQPLLSFQYISHRALRWSIAPFLLIVMFVTNALIVLEDARLIYTALLCCQVTFYILASIGLLLEKRKLKVKIAFIPYYFSLMNYAVILGIFKYFRKEQSSVWEKAERSRDDHDKVIALSE